MTSLMAAFSCAEATTAEALGEIRRFRYRIYVEELGKPLDTADHCRKELVDPLDDGAIHFACRDAAGELVGTVRLHLGPASLFPQPIAERLGIEGFLAGHGKPVGLISKLMITPGLRGRGVVLRLLSHLYSKGRDQGAVICFGHCHPRWVPMYEKLGVRQFGHLFEDPAAGTQVPMVYILEDEAHYRQCRSPLLPECLKYPNDPARVRELCDRFFVRVPSEQSNASNPHSDDALDPLPDEARHPPVSQPQHPSPQHPSHLRTCMTDANLSRLMALIEDAQRRFAAFLRDCIASDSVSPDSYVRYLLMQYHLTRGVHRYFITAAAHSDLARRKRLRKFLVDFANEEELHHLVAANDVHKLGRTLLPEPFDVTLWHAYFEKIIVERPFIRLGAACILENISSGEAREPSRRALSAPFLNHDNTKFLVLHQHETVPHGQQIVDVLAGADLDATHWADVLDGACKGTVLYLRMAEWAVDPTSLAAVASPAAFVLDEREQQAIERFDMGDLVSV